MDANSLITLIGVIVAAAVAISGLILSGNRRVRDDLARIDRRFESVDHRFESIDRRFDSIDHRFESIDHRFESIDRRFDSIDHRFDSIDHRFDSIDHRFESIDHRLRAVEQGQARITGMLEVVMRALQIRIEPVDPDSPQPTGAGD